LGTNIFIPNLTILRRYEFATNFSVTSRPITTSSLAPYELLRAITPNRTPFSSRPFVFGSLPGFLISPQLATTTINPLQSASFGCRQVYQQGFGNPTYRYYSRPLTAFYGQVPGKDRAKPHS